jgi:hypothetical protein
MPTLAGMDLGYGSQVKLVRTNFLFTEVLTNGTAQAYANLLHIYNQTVGPDSLLKADYIVPVVANAEVAPTNSTVDPVVADLSSSKFASLIGPSRSFLASQSDIGTGNIIPAGQTHNAAYHGVAANGQILGVVNSSVLVFGGADFTTPTVVELLATTTTVSEVLNANLLADSISGPVSYLDLTALADDATVATTLSVTGDLVMTEAALTTSFVMKGNAAGNTETVVGDLTGIAANTCSLASVTALVRSAQ